MLSEPGSNTGLGKLEWAGETAPDCVHRERGDSRDGYNRSGTDRGFNCPLSLLKAVCGAEDVSWALEERKPGPEALVGVLGPPILERTCLSYA